MAATAQVTVPGPVLDAPPINARNADSLAAVHPQAGPVVTCTWPVPAGHSTSRCNGVTVQTHGTSTETRPLRDASPPSTAAATWYV